MQRVLLVLAAALAAVAVVVPAASARVFTVRAGGYVFDDPSAGTVQTLGKFRIDLRAGQAGKVTYVDRTRHLFFHSLLLQNTVFTRNAVKLIGIGLVDGERVQFTAIATDHPTGLDAFRIAWDHRAAHGGNVLSGNVRVTQISLY